MRLRLSAGLALTLGLCLATSAFALWAVEATALDHGPLHREARAMLDTKPVQRAMASRVADAIAARVPPGVAVDPVAVGNVAESTLRQPEFIEAFAGGLDQIQARVVDGAGNPITLDPTLVGPAVRTAGANQPELASTLASDAPFVVAVTDDQVPDLARWADIWQAATRFLAAIAVLLIAYALLRIEHRAWAVGRIGRTTIVVGFATIAVFWVVPRVLLSAMGGWISVAGLVIGADEFLVPVAIGLIASGVVAVLVTHRWEARDRRRFLSVIPRAPTRAPGAANHWESPV